MTQLEYAKKSTGVVVAEKPPIEYRLRRGRNWFFLGLTYASYYLCRYNLSPIAPELMKELGFSKSQYGLINSGRDGAYAVGQMINGLFTDRFGGKQAMTIGGIGTILLNLAFGFASWASLGSWMLATLVVIRALDGYIQAFGAPGFIKINTAWFRRRERGGFSGIFGFMINMGAIGAGKLAQLVSYGFVIPLLFFSITVPPKWRYLFFLPPIVVAIALVCLNLLVKNTPEEAGFQVEHDDDPPGDPNQKISLATVFRRIASQPTVWIVAGAYFCTGFVRRGIESWWAVYLDEVWHADKESNLFTYLVWGLPVTASLGSLISGYISDIVFKGRRAPVAAILYAFQTVLCIAALAMPHGGAAASGFVVVSVIIAASMVCNSTHSILGTAAAMDLGGRRMAGCSAGIIDSFQYYGALLSGGALGQVFDWAGAVDKTHKMSPTIWFGSMIPFGLIGAALMGYLCLKERGKPISSH